MKFVRSLSVLCVKRTFSTRIFYWGDPGFATACPCGVCCRGLTTCLLLVDPLWNLILNNSWFFEFDITENTFLHCFSSLFCIRICIYLNISQHNLNFSFVRLNVTSQKMLYFYLIPLCSLFRWTMSWCLLRHIRFDIIRLISPTVLSKLVYCVHLVCVFVLL